MRVTNAYNSSPLAFSVNKNGRAPNISTLVSDMPQKTGETRKETQFTADLTEKATEADVRKARQHQQIRAQRMSQLMMLRLDLEAIKVLSEAQQSSPVVDQQAISGTEEENAASSPAGQISAAGFEVASDIQTSESMFLPGNGETRTSVFPTAGRDTMTGIESAIDLVDSLLNGMLPSGMTMPGSISDKKA